TDWQAYRLNDPLLAFESTKHPGRLGKQFSFLKVSSQRVRVLALKKAEQDDAIVVRLVELDGKPVGDVHIAFAAPIASASEINAQEQPLGAANVERGELVTSFNGYQPRSFAVRLSPPPQPMTAPRFASLALPYDISAASSDGRPASGCFDCWFDRPSATPQGKALPAEMLPEKIDYAGITFTLVPAGTGQPDALTTKGQILDLPQGNFNRLYLLAAAANGDQQASFTLGDRSTMLNVQEWTGFIGQWDDRIWKSVEEPVPQSDDVRAGSGRRPRMRTNEYGEMLGLSPGFIKRADIAWFASHRHDSGARNEAYQYSYLFAYVLDVPSGAKTLTLPRNPNIRLLAATVANQPEQVWPVQPLYDDLGRSSPER
ncbi:MAG: alpha-mannosidase, partial [Acidobacteria bacterium]|nr:alpha-mannosidase [Acidobacteriota bacterium]